MESCASQLSTSLDIHRNCSAWVGVHWTKQEVRNAYQVADALNSFKDGVFTTAYETDTVAYVFLLMRMKSRVPYSDLPVGSEPVVTVLTNATSLAWDLCSPVCCLTLLRDNLPVIKFKGSKWYIIQWILVY